MNCYLCNAEIESKWVHDLTTKLASGKTVTYCMKCWKLAHLVSKEKTEQEIKKEQFLKEAQEASRLAMDNSVLAGGPKLVAKTLHKNKNVELAKRLLHCRDIALAYKYKINDDGKFVKDKQGKRVLVPESDLIEITMNQLDPASDFVQECDNDFVELAVKTLDDIVMFLTELLAVRFNFAKMVKQRQNNLYVWNGKIWDNNTRTPIENYLRVVYYFSDRENRPNLTSKIIDDIVTRLRSHPNTQQVELDFEYHQMTMLFPSDPNGNYIDLDTFTIRQVDPATQFYLHPQLGFELNKDWKEPKEILSLLQERLDAPKEFVDNQAAAMLPQNKLRHDKRKTLNLVGPTDAGKSLILTQTGKIHHKDNRIHIGAHDLARDQFGPARMANKIISTVAEGVRESDKIRRTLKSFQGDEDSTARDMRTTKDTDVHHWPIFRIGWNLLPGEYGNDDLESLYNREIIIFAKPPKDKTGKDWEDILSTGMQDYMMLVLYRAHKILRDSNELKTHTIKETEKRYAQASHGWIEGTFNQYFKKDRTKAVSWTAFKKTIRDNSKIKPTDYLLKEYLTNEHGLETIRTRVYTTPDEDLFYAHNPDVLDTFASGKEIQRTVVMGLTKKIPIQSQL